MADTRFHPYRVIRDTWLARFGKIVSWIGIVFWGLLSMVGFAEWIGGNADSAVDKVMPFVCLALAALHGLLLNASGKTSALIGDYRLYSAVLARDPDRSVQELSNALDVSSQKVTDQLQRMCRRGYFNGYLDHQQQKMQLFQPQDPTNLRVVYCSGCGAKNALTRAGGTCRYCSAPLSLP